MFSPKSRKSKRLTYTHSGGYDSVAIRMARPGDEQAIVRLAALDGRRAPEGRVLVAEADSEIIAALPVDGGAAVSDPFRWTGDVIALMEVRAAQLAAPHRARTVATGKAVRALRARLS